MAISLFEWTAGSGFLPTDDPPPALPQPQYSQWEQALTNLSKHLVAAGGGALRHRLLALPDFDLPLLLHPLAPEPHLWRAYLLLSFLSHAYVWGEEDPPPSLPAKFAVPWCRIAATLDMPPVLTYATYNLLNWRRLDPDGPIALGNIVCLHNFNGGLDEEWFRLVHVDIEARAAPGLAAIVACQLAVAARDAPEVCRQLSAMSACLVSVSATLERMRERCDPYMYYHRVRRFMGGWRDNPALPQGLLYEGVGEGAGAGAGVHLLYGETGAQSTIVPAYDAILGVEHKAGWLSDYLKVMRCHMPPTHRTFLQRIEEGPALRPFVTNDAIDCVDAYNACLKELFKFRSQHRGFAYEYIAKHNPTREERGTGGTDFMPYLATHAKSTSEHLVGALSS